MGRTLTFQQIQVFKTVMETGTTTKAALALNTTQPSISRKLADLQAVAGLQLFVLHHGRLRPTSEGRHLYQSIRKHFEGLEKIETVLGILRKSGAGVLRIGSTPTLATGLLPRVIDRFMQRFPGAFINLRTEATQQLEEHLSQELIDIALTTGTMDKALFRCSTVGKSKAVCIVPHGHELAGRATIDLDMLEGSRLILLNDSDNIVVRMRELLAEGGYQADIAVETNSSITICALVAAGIGIGVVNPYVASTFAGQFAVKELTPSIPVEVLLAQSITLAPSTLTRAFSQLLKSS